MLRRTREEVPHAVEVQVEEIELRDDGLVEVHAQVWVETQSQKGILVGKGGRMVREIGTAARKELERDLGAASSSTSRSGSASTGAATTPCSIGSASSSRLVNSSKWSIHRRRRRSGSTSTAWCPA